MHIHMNKSIFNKYDEENYGWQNGENDGSDEKLKIGGKREEREVGSQGRLRKSRHYGVTLFYKSLLKWTKFYFFNFTSFDFTGKTVLS